MFLTERFNCFSLIGRPSVIVLRLVTICLSSLNVTPLSPPVITPDEYIPIVEMVLSGALNLSVNELSIGDQS